MSHNIPLRKNPCRTKESWVNRREQQEQDPASKRDKQRKRVECPVCYEYMEDLFGCRNVCRSWFCHPCLRRVLPSRWLCPNQFTLQSVVSDENLWKEIDDQEDTVTCSFWVCSDKLKIRRISMHNTNCPHIWVRCWHANWGCVQAGQGMEILASEVVIWLIWGIIVVVST